MTKHLTGIFFLCILLVSCKKETVTSYSEPLTDYFPLETGKYITYQLDSTVTVSFGTQFVVNSYQLQDRVEEKITDNNGREGFRINRYIRLNSNQGWTPYMVLMAIPSRNSIEYYENNLRYIKLMAPIREGFSWKGNAYIDTYSNDLGVTYLDGWDYTYDSMHAPLTINDVTIDSTITVSERDEFLGQDPSIPGTLYGEKTYAVEKYAKHIGLVYREFIHWEYQAPPDRVAYYAGYGIKMTMIDHN